MNFFDFVHDYGSQQINPLGLIKSRQNDPSRGQSKHANQFRKVEQGKWENVVRDGVTVGGITEKMGMRKQE